MQNRYLRLIVLQSIGCLFDYGIYGLSEKYFILTVQKGPSNYWRIWSESRSDNPARSNGATELTYEVDGPVHLFGPPFLAAVEFRSWCSIVALENPLNLRGPNFGVKLVKLE